MAPFSKYELLEKPNGGCQTIVMKKSGKHSATFPPCYAAL